MVRDLDDSTTATDCYPATITQQTGRRASLRLRLVGLAANLSVRSTPFCTCGSCCGDDRELAADKRRPAVMRTRLLVCCFATVMVLTGCGSGGTSDEALEEATASARAAEDQAGSTSMRCVEEYSSDTLRERAFAFDGTAVNISSEEDPRAPDKDIVTGHVEFQVHEWFAGGTGDVVTVWMQRSVEPGDRLLVAGEPRWGGEPVDDAIAHECGFTASYSDAGLKEWSAAFAEEG